MTFWHNYPYTDFHELNLDWVLKQIHELEVRLEKLKSEIIDEIRSEMLSELQKLKDELNNFKQLVNNEIAKQNELINSKINEINALISVVDQRIELLENSFEVFKDNLLESIDKQLRDYRDEIIKELSETVVNYYVHNYLTGHWVAIQDMFDYLCKLHIAYPLTNNQAIMLNITRDRAKELANNSDITNLIVNGGNIFI